MKLIVLSIIFSLITGSALAEPFNPFLRPSKSNKNKYPKKLNPSMVVIAKESAIPFKNCSDEKLISELNFELNYQKQVKLINSDSSRGCILGATTEHSWIEVIISKNGIDLLIDENTTQEIRVSKLNLVTSSNSYTFNITQKPQ